MLCYCAPKVPNSKTEIKLLRQVLWHLTERNQVSIQLVIQYVTVRIISMLWPC